MLAGVCGTDPFRLDAAVPAPSSPASGFAGVQNFPTVGLIDGTFRQDLEETGMGFGLEVEMIARGRTTSDLLTAAYVFDARTRRGRWPRPAPTSSCRTWA